MIELTMALAGSLVLAIVPALAPMVARLPRRYQHQIDSFSGGAGLAYVVLYLLFELAKYGAPKIHALLPLGPEPLESLFMLLLCALLLNYVLQAQLQGGPGRENDYFGFALSFMIYNFVAGGGMVEQARWGALRLAFYVTALGLHLLFNDLFLLHLALPRRHRRWRLALAAMPLLGCAVAAVGALSEGVLYAMLAVIAGGTVINVVRRELPSPRAVRSLAFVAGALVYAALIIATWRF
jgi:hypothetical protein